MNRPKGLYVLDHRSHDLIYGPQERRDIESRVDITAPPQTAASIRTLDGMLGDLELLFTGWGAPLLDEAFLKSTPRLKAVFYGSGSVAKLITPAVWKRDIAITSAYAANAIPVAEYTLGVILFSLKHGWRLSRLPRQQRKRRVGDEAPGCLGSVVGLVSMGMTARTLLRMLAPFNLEILAFDPYLTAAEAEAMGVKLVSLEELFRRSDVVSIHTPLLDETQWMITGTHIALMKSGATLINTARGEIVCEEQMIRVLSDRPDLQAVLDVSVKEPPEEDSPLYSLPNVVLTPHIAGSVGAECRRMGRLMVDELNRYLAGQPMQWQVTEDMINRTSHCPTPRAVHVTINAPSKPLAPAI
jgi:phosphoglycerate dehydrogenase-like enzyme